MGEITKCKMGVENNLLLCFSDSERESGLPSFLRIPLPIDLPVNVPVDTNICVNCVQGANSKMR